MEFSLRVRYFTTVISSKKELKLDWNSVQAASKLSLVNVRYIDAYAVLQ